MHDLLQMGRKQKVCYRKRHYTPSHTKKKFGEKITALSLPKAPSLPEGWVIPDSTSLITVGYFQAEQDSIPVATHYLKVSRDGSYTTTVYGKKVTLDYPSPILDITTTLPHILNTLMEMKVCPGNNCTEFIELAVKREGNFVNKEGTLCL